MENEKVVVPKEVAEAIEELRRKGVSGYGVLNRAKGALTLEPDLTIRKWAFEEGGEGSPDMLMEALVNGYEVESDPHEELRDFYVGAIFSGEDALPATEIQRLVGMRAGVRRTLSILGIEVEGINA